jgi:hypothetical protein
MSIQAPQGILNIPNATLRVGKLAVDEVVGADTILNTVARNTILLVDDEAYHENKNWSLKLPNAWAGEFECNTASAGNYSEFNFYNEGASSNAQGYNLTFNDTAVELRYDGTLLKTGTLASTITGTGVKKVRLMFERTILSVTVDGTLVFTHDDTVGPRPRVYSTTAGGFLNFFTDGGALKNLKIVNEKWMSDGTSNIAYVGGGEVAVGQALAFNRVSNVSQIKVDSNVVTEYTGPHDRPLRKYPEIILPRAAVGADYNGYRIERSSEYVTGPYLGVQSLFNNTAVDYADTWGAGINGTNFSYSASTGEHTAYVTGGTTQGTAARLASNVPNGEWVSLKSPNAIKLDNIQIRSRNASDWFAQFPTDFQIWGSNDGTTWSHIKTFTGQSASGQSILHTYHINSTIFYNRHALVVTKIPGETSSGANDGAAHLSISELRFNGHEEGSGSLDTTLKSVYNVPATTGTQLEVYYDAKDLVDMPANVTDLSPNSNDGSVSGDPQVSNGAFTFDGTGDYITNTRSGYISSGTYTVSTWVNISKEASGQTNPNIFQYGRGQTSTTDTGIGLITSSSDDRITAFVYGNNDFIVYGLKKYYTWIHLTSIYELSASGTNITLYVNGNNVGSQATSTAAGIGATPHLSIGVQANASDLPITSTHFNGSIANFRLYSKALNADQVKELYDYQKDYFLGSKSQVTLYKGHLGVGVTEPSGQLELAGDERLQEYPPRAMTKNETLVEGHGVFSALGGTGGETYAPWKAFDKSTSTFWIDGGIRYSDVTPFGALSTASKTTLYDGSVLSGGWIDLECPYPVKLKRVGTAPRTNYPSIGLQRGIILGSNNGVDWYQIDTIDYAGTTPPNTLTYFDITTETYYSHLRLVCTNLTARYPASGTSDMHWQMGELVYFGTPGPTTLDKGSLSLTRSLDVPRISRYDVDTETPRYEKLLVDFDTTVNSSPTDISGKGNHGTFYGDAQYSPADKAFKFDGTDDCIQTGAGVISGTNPIFSISLWVNYSGTGSETFCMIGDTYGTNTTVWCDVDTSDGRPRMNFINNDVTFSDPNTGLGVLTPNVWNHIVYVFNGATSGGRSAYVNGVKQVATAEGGTSPNGNLVLPSSSVITIGALDHSSGFIHELIGKISNFKIYSVALEPSEVRKLYNLGRTGRSMVISDTAVGIGKVPEAQLDVRGTANFAGSVGIGTTSPYAKLEISSTTQDSNVAFQNVNQLRINCTNTNSSTGTGGGITFCQRYFSGSDSMIATGGVFGTRLGSINGNYGGGLVFKYKPNGSGPIVEGMVLSSAGKFGIGTDNPGTKLEVHHDVPKVAQFYHTNASRGSYISIKNHTGTLCHIGADGQQFMTQETNSIGLFNTNTGNINYQTNGQRRAYLNSAGRFHAQSFGIYSDERIKDNITDVDDEESLEIIKQLQPKNFVMRENRDVKRWGFIAQDIEQLVPEVVSSDSTSKLYIKKKYEIISYNPPVKLSDVVYSNISVTEYATLDANTQAHYTGPDSGNTYYSNIVSEAVYSKSNVSARITDEVFDIGECVQLSNDETYSLNVCCVNVTSVSNNVYVFQDDCIITADDRNLVDMNLTDYIYVKSKDIDNVKTINYEFIHPTLISAVQQMMRIIDRLTERVTVLENR